MNCSGNGQPYVMLYNGAKEMALADNVKRIYFHMKKNKPLLLQRQNEFVRFEKQSKIQI